MRFLATAALFTLAACLARDGHNGVGGARPAQDEQDAFVGPPDFRAEMAEEIRQLAQKKLEVAKRGYDHATRKLKLGEWLGEGDVDVEECMVWETRLLESELDVATGKADRITAYEHHLDHVMVLDLISGAGHEDAKPGVRNLHAYREVEARLMLAKCKAK